MYELRIVSLQARDLTESQFVPADARRRPASARLARRGRKSRRSA